MGELASDFSGNTEALKQRFITVWDRNLVPGCLSQAVTAANVVINKHLEHHRHYHNTRHLLFCLAEHSQAASTMEEPDVVELALWFHDVIYIPDATDNERKSAELFLQLAEGQLPEPLKKPVSDIIQATCHKALPDTQNEAYVLDIDLASIGLPWEEFNRDNEALRAEVPRIHDNLYYEGKVSFLSSLLAREKIYCTPYFYDKYEAQARGNIEQFLLSTAK